MKRVVDFARLVSMTSLLVLAGCPGGGGGGGQTPTYRLGGTVAGLNGAGLVLQNNGGDDLSVAASGGANVAFTFATSLASGAGYAVTVRTQPGGPAQTCAVLRNGSGTVGGANLTNVLVDCHTPRFAYVANVGSGGSDAVSMYRVDAASGRLVNLGNVAGGMFPSSVAVDPAGKYAYVTSRETGTVYQYTIATSGLLQPMTPGSVWMGGSPEFVSVHPSGSYAYVTATGAGDQVSQFTVDAGGGLTAMTPATVATGVRPQSIVFDPTGRFAYVANAGAALNPSTVSQYTVGAGGALTPMTPTTAAAGVNPRSVTVDPTGRFAYVTNQGDGVAPGTVSQYAIGAGGALTPLNPATVATGVTPETVVVDPTGRFAYVANAGGNSVSQFHLGADGALSPLTPATVATGTSPQSVVVDPAGKHAWVTDSGANAVAQYTIGADGSLSPSVPATVVAGPSPAAMAMVVTSPTSPGAAAIAATFAYVANNGPGSIGGVGYWSTVSGYAPGASGELGLVNSAEVFTGYSPNGAKALAVDPSGRYLYVATTAFVSQYAIGQTGALTPMATPHLLVCYICTAIAVHPSGAYAYVVDNSYSGPNTTPTIPNAIMHFSVGADGSLTPFAAPGNALAIEAGVPISIALDPTGRFAYVVNLEFGDVGWFAVDAFGTLTHVGQLNTGVFPRSVAVDPSGRFVYVANSGSDDVSAYTIDGTTGALTQIDCGTGAGCKASPRTTATNFAAGVGPFGIAVDPGGKFLYTANVGDGTNPGSVSQFTIGPTGALTPMATASVAAGVNARAVTVDPTGRWVYVANEGDLTNPSTVSQYAVGPSGALTPMTAATVAASVRPYAIVSTATYQ